MIDNTTEMVKIELSRAQELFANFKSQKIAVIGDIMLDRYMWGTVQRISPEAPVPVVEVTSETIKLGGAANVANNILSLGAQPIPIGVVGDDDYGAQLRKLFAGAGLQTEGIWTDPGRSTTIKTRIIAHDQHVVRADVESKEDISDQAVSAILNILKTLLPNLSGVIMEDYNKGVLVPRLIEEVVNICRQQDCFVAVDPKFKYFFAYDDVDLFKPNTKETEQALGIKIESNQDLIAAAQQLFSRLHCKSILLTRGEKGMALFPSATEKPLFVATRAKKVYDVSGAGDTVIATLVVAKLAGASLLEAATLANYAAGIVCEEVGVVPIDKDRLMNEIRSDFEAESAP